MCPQLLALAAPLLAPVGEPGGGRGLVPFPTLLLDDDNGGSAVALGVPLVGFVGGVLAIDLGDLDVTDLRVGLGGRLERGDGAFVEPETQTLVGADRVAFQQAPGDQAEDERGRLLVIDRDVVQVYNPALVGQHPGSGTRVGVHEARTDEPTRRVRPRGLGPKRDFKLDLVEDEVGACPFAQLDGKYHVGRVRGVDVQVRGGDQAWWGGSLDRERRRIRGTDELSLYQRRADPGRNLNHRLEVRGYVGHLSGHGLYGDPGW